MVSQASATTGIGWTDQYGTIAGEVYEAAERGWPQMESFARQTLGDPQAAQQLLMKACALVTKSMANEPGRITHLSAYLEVTWKRLVLAELEKERKQQQHQMEIAHDAQLTATDTVQQIEQQILVQEIVARMDDWTRTVFEYQMLGHSFEEMSQTLGQSGHVIRTKFGKKLKKLKQQLASET